MAKEMMFSLAIRKKKFKEDFFWMHDDYEFKICDIDCKDRYWLADPFLFERDGTAYIFYEAFDLILHKGIIGYSRLREDGSFTPPKMVIEEPYHLSFPYIFEKEGSIYIMPEGCADYSIRLYKAIDFPDKWERDIIVNDDIFACDSILLNWQDREYILSNRMYHYNPEGSLKSCWVKNYLYPLENNKAIGDGIKVSEGDYGTRNAGKSFRIGDSLYRIGQDCRDAIYGKGLTLFKIIAIKPYQEEIIWNKDYNEFKNHIIDGNRDSIKGAHTYNFSENYEIIDFSFYREMAYKTKVKRYIHLANRLLEQIKIYL